MRILLTNAFLANQTGSELYIRDIAVGLLRRGHTPIAFSPTLGQLAAEMRLATIPTIDNLNSIGEPPDIIHGHHHLETMAAVTRFPSVPAIAFCHGWLPWEEAPVRFPSIQRYIAVSETNRERLISEGGIPASAVTILPNFVDLERFRPRAPLPSKPHRALVFSNQISEDHYLAKIRRACIRHKICLDIVGRANGNATEHPEDLLINYDLVFARGRAALECLAVGTSVILCDSEGLGPMITMANFEQLRIHNMGLRVLANPLDEELLSIEIAKYDARDAQELAAHARATIGIDPAIDCLCTIYEQTIASFRPTQDPSIGAQLLSQYLTWVSRTVENDIIADRNLLGRKLAELTSTQRQLETINQNIQTAYSQLQTEYSQILERHNHLVYQARMIEDTLTWRVRQQLTKSRLVMIFVKIVKKFWCLH